MLDPKRNIYLEVPYRTLTHPAVTAWEQRAATKRLRDEGRAKVDEFAIFNAIEQMRAITDAAVKHSRAARRNRSRRSNLDRSTTSKVARLPTMAVQDTAEVAPAFDDIEEWL